MRESHKCSNVCFCCENKTGARIVAVLDVIIAVASIIAIIFLLEMLEQTKANNPPELYPQMRSYLIRCIILAAVNVLFGLLIFIGIHLKNQILLRVYVIGKGFTAGYLIVNIFYVNFLFIMPSLVMIYFIVVASAHLNEIKKELLTNSETKTVKIYSNVTN